MTQAISENTQIDYPIWRRHTDPPGFWVAVAITSVLLHLLPIWLIKFSGGNLFGHKSYTSVIPIEVVEVNPDQQGKKSASRPRKSSINSTRQITTNNSSTKPAAKKSVTEGIALTENRKKQRSQPNSVASPSPTQKKTVAQKPQEKQSIKPESQQQREQKNTGVQEQSSNTRTQKQTQPSPTPTPVKPPQASPTPTPVPPPQPPANNLPNQGDIKKPWEGKRENIELGEGKKLPDNPLNSSQSSQSSSSDRQIGGFILKINPLSRDEAIALTTGRKVGGDPPPDNMAVYTGSTETNLDISILTSHPALQSAQILASLVINQTGQFEQAIVLEINPPDLAPKRKQYQDFLNSHFRNQKFLPGYNNNGTKPVVSNLILKIAIEQQERQKTPDLPGSMLENQ